MDFVVVVFFFSSVIFPHAVFIVRKVIVISIVPIQYCLAHLNKLISVIYGYSIVLMCIFVLLHISSFIHRAIAIQPFHESNMCVCVYLWWPSR